MDSEEEEEDESDAEMENPDNEIMPRESTRRTRATTQTQPPQQQQASPSLTPEPPLDIGTMEMTMELVKN